MRREAIKDKQRKCNLLLFLSKKQACAKSQTWVVKETNAMSKKRFILYYSFCACLSFLLCCQICAGKCRAFCLRGCSLVKNWVAFSAKLIPKTSQLTPQPIAANCWFAAWQMEANWREAKQGKTKKQATKEKPFIFDRSNIERSFARDLSCESKKGEMRARQV